MSERELEIAFYRAMQRSNAYLDPFTVMEVITLLKPIAGIPLETIKSDETLNFKLQSVIEHIGYIFKKLGVDEPEETAKSIVEEVLEHCLRVCPKNS